MALVKHAAIAAAYKRHEWAHVNKQRTGDAIVEPDQSYTPRELLSMFCRGTLPQMSERSEYDEDPLNEEPQWVPCTGQPLIDICEKRDELLARARTRQKPEPQKPEPPKPEPPKPEPPKPEPQKQEPKEPQPLAE